MKKILLALLIVPVFFAFRADTPRADVHTPVINGKGIYVLSIPHADFNITTTIDLNGLSGTYADVMSQAINKADASGVSYDALLVRDGRNAHCISYNNSVANQVGDAIEYGGYSFFFMGEPVKGFDQVNVISFDQKIGPDRSHSQMMNELLEVTRTQASKVNAVILDGNNTVRFAQLVGR